MEERRRRNTLPHEGKTDEFYGYVPDGQYGVNEFVYPDYPDLPYPDTLERWGYQYDPVLQDDGQNPRQTVWDPEDPHSPWHDPFFPHYR